MIDPLVLREGVEDQLAYHLTLSLQNMSELNMSMNIEIIEIHQGTKRSDASPWIIGRSNVSP